MPPFLILTKPCAILTPSEPPKVAVPVKLGLLAFVIVGLVNVLFVKVSVVVLPTSVSVVAGKVI